MAHAVFVHRHDSVYEDIPEEVYDFPERYLSLARKVEGDWIIYYEPVRAGPRGYFAAARVDRIIPKPNAPGRYLAHIAPGDYIDFDRFVPRTRADGRLWESGLPPSGGRNQSAIRPLSKADFADIVNAGLPGDLETRADAPAGIAAPGAPAPGVARPAGMEDPPAVFERPVIERLTRRPYRDAAFRHRVRKAYGYRCAISGIELRNGGGRPEVQAAHIKPVEEGGPDSVRNGLGLSATVHWMFDRGLISVEPGSHRILVSENKVPRDVVERLILPERRLHLPASRADWPHPKFLKWHQEHRFGQGDYAPPPAQA